MPDVRGLEKRGSAPQDQPAFLPVALPILVKLRCHRAGLRDHALVGPKAVAPPFEVISMMRGRAWLGSGARVFRLRAQDSPPFCLPLILVVQCGCEVHAVLVSEVPMKSPDEGVFMVLNAFVISLAGGACTVLDGNLSKTGAPMKTTFARP